MGYFFRCRTSYYNLSNENNEITSTLTTDNIDSISFDAFASTMSPIDVINDLTGEEVIKFYNHLVKYPFLGLLDDVGKKIFDELGKKELYSIKDITLFRARQRNIEEHPHPYNELEMFEAPYGVSGQGRFNVSGHGELYTCGSKKIALEEIGIFEDKLKVYDVVEWKLVESVKVLDLTNKESELIKFILIKKVSSNSQEYLLPNFIAQCAKYHKINGIRVRSSIDNTIFNYIFFDFEKRWFELVKLHPNSIL